MDQEKLVYVSGNEATTCLNRDAILLDVRPEFETAMRVFGLGKIIYIPYTEIESRLHELPADKTLIVADAVGLRSKEVCIFLTEKGFKNIILLAGGIVDWERSGLPVIKNPSKQLHGQCPCMMREKS